MPDAIPLEPQTFFRFTVNLPDGDEAVYSAAASRLGVAFARLYEDKADPTPFDVALLVDDGAGQSHETICRRAINQAFRDVLFLAPMNAYLDKGMPEWAGKLVRT
ncbi:hypothetical protein [Cupriavidus necator]